MKCETFTTRLKDGRGDIERLRQGGIMGNFDR